MDGNLTFTSFEMGLEQFFDLLYHVSHLVSKQQFAFALAVSEGLSFTITNEVMDVDGEYLRLKPFFTCEGLFLDAELERRFVEEVRHMVLAPGVLAELVKRSQALATPEMVEDLRRAAAVS